MCEQCLQDAMELCWNKSLKIFLWSKTKLRAEIRALIDFEILVFLVKKKMTIRRGIARNGIEGVGVREWNWF